MEELRAVPNARLRTKKPLRGQQRFLIWCQIGSVVTNYIFFLASRIERPKARTVLHQLVWEVISPLVPNDRRKLDGLGLTDEVLRGFYKYVDLSVDIYQVGRDELGFQWVEDCFAQWFQRRYSLGTFSLVCELRDYKGFPDRGTWDLRLSALLSSLPRLWTGN